MILREKHYIGGLGILLLIGLPVLMGVMGDTPDPISRLKCWQANDSISQCQPGQQDFAPLHEVDIPGAYAARLEARKGRRERTAQIAQLKKALSEVKCKDFWDAPLGNKACPEKVELEDLIAQLEAQ